MADYYFPAFQAESSLSYIDGGIWANTPVTVGIFEALAILEKSAEDIELLSIGTTDAPYYVNVTKRFGGLIGWNKHLVFVQIQAQSMGAIAQAKVLLKDRFFRVNPTIQPNRFSIDNSKQIAELKALGITEARHREYEINQRFLDALAEPFVPCHRLD